MDCILGACCIYSKGNYVVVEIVSIEMKGPHKGGWVSLKWFLFPTSPLILGYETCDYKLIQAYTLIQACQSGVAGNSKFVICTYAYENSLEECCSLLYVHTIDFLVSSIWVLQWPTSPTPCGQFSTCWWRSTYKWHFLSMVHMVEGA